MNTFGVALRGFLADDSAQDLVEYAYLAVFVGLVGVAVWGSIVQLLGIRYAGYNAGVQTLWCSPNPNGTPISNCP
jgi:Flp pilus assembly pilin Flp